MPTTIIIRAEILCLAIILYLIAYSLYCSKYHHAKSNFLVLAFTCFIHTLFAVITELTVNDPGCNVFVNNIYHLIFFAFALLFCLELFRLYAGTYSSCKSGKNPGNRSGRNLSCRPCVYNYFTD